MIIDLIIERKDGTKYNPEDFYKDVCDYEEIFFKEDDTLPAISKAMESKNEWKVKKELCWYIISQEYNPELCSYIMSVKWL